jgi:hypothetical protein
MMMINLVGCSVNYFPTMCELDSCFPRMINQLELNARGIQLHQGTLLPGSLGIHAPHLA